MRRVREGEERAPAVAGRARLLRARRSVEQQARRSAEHAHAGDEAAARVRAAVDRRAVAARDHAPVAATDSAAGIDSADDQPRVAAAPGADAAGHEQQQL